MSQTLYDLPEGWEWVTLDDVTVDTANLSPEKSPETLWTYIDISAIDKDKFSVVEPKEILGKDAPSRAKKQIQQGDVLFATTRPNLKNIAVFELSVSNPVASTGFCVLRPAERIVGKFLFYFVTTDFVQQQIEPFISGASYPAVTDKNLKKVEISLPPLAEQTRIVEKLDAVLSRIDTAIDELQQSLALVDAMFKSGLDGVFSGFSEDISRVPFKDLVVNLDGQRVPIKSDERKSTHGTYPYYGATGVIDYVDEYIFDGENLLISEDGANLVARKYPIAFIATGKYWVNNHAHVVCAKPEVTTNRYLQWFFAWCDLSSYITGSAQPKLSQGKLNTIPVPVPSLERQKNVVEELDALNDKTTQLKTEITAKIGMFNQLKASVLDGAFRGDV